MKKEIFKSRLKKGKKRQRRVMSSKLIIILAILMVLSLGGAIYSNYYLIKNIGNMRVSGPDPFGLNMVDNSKKFDSSPDHGVSNVQTTENEVGMGGLKIKNDVPTPEYGKSSLVVRHQDGYLEAGDSEDILWANVPGSPYAAWLMIYSDPYGVELRMDSRPLASLTDIEIKLAVITNDGNPEAIESNNSLVLRFLDEKSFVGKTVTLRQFYPTAGQAYNVKDVISYNDGVIELEPLNGTYADEGVYAKFWLSFDEE
ncbi:hypothetical protein GOV14_04450 [Candidatus Pacearchaeota archaeon]|nr:hypothetical protein [Candidatus Pacearchaeota archaeon]